MPAHRKPRATALVAVLTALGPALAACSGSGGSTPVRPLLKAPAPRMTTAYSATRPDSGTPSAEDMRVTAGRLRNRAKALGVEDTDIRVKGAVVTVSGPRADADLLRKIAATADLEFRPVLDPSAAARNGLGKAYDTMVCGSRTRPTPSLPERPTVSCDPAKDQKYLLGPAAVGGTSVESASAVLDTANGNGWVVNLTFDRAGSRKFAEITGTLAQQPPPADQFAIVIDEKVISAPAVMSAITGGKAQITGDFSKAEAQALAAAITSGALPVQLTPRDGGRS